MSPYTNYSSFVKRALLYLWEFKTVPKQNSNTKMSNHKFITNSSKNALEWFNHSKQDLPWMEKLTPTMCASMHRRDNHRHLTSNAGMPVESLLSMAFNVSKCKVVHFSRKKLPSVHHLMNKNYYLSGNQLENVPNISDLGITITNNLSWFKHIEEIVSKANRTLGLVKRLCRDIKDTNTRKLLYCTVVRPKLEYCSSLWSPYTGKHRLLIENVQRRATRFILNYPKDDMSYPLRLQKLRLLPLEFRREISDLTLLFKSRNWANNYGRE